MNSTKRWVGIAAAGLGIYGLGNLFQPTVVVGSSMSPTLKSGKMIWVDRTAYLHRSPQPGEVVVFRHHGETYVKRVYQGPGKTIHYVASGVEWLGPVRDSQVEATREKYRRLRHSTLRLATAKIPDDSFFAIGDNYNNSIDSRQLGPIPVSEIIGRVRMPADATICAQYEMSPKPIRRTFENRQMASR